MQFTDHCNPSALKFVHCFLWYIRHCTSVVLTPTHLSPHAQTLAAKTMIVIRWFLLFVCYSTTLNSTDIFTLGKGKALASTNGVEAYSKETLGDEIRRLTTANAQLMTDKMKIEKARVNLEADRTRLLDEKNSLIAKKEELRAEIATLNVANVPIRGH